MLLLAQEAAQNIDQAVEIEAQVQQMSNLTYLLQAGGLPFLVMGVIMGIVGLILLLKPRRTVTAAIYAFVSLLPGVIALISVYTACSEFVEMGSSPAPPKPAELFGVIGRAMGRCFYGLLATLIPMLLAIIAFIRASPNGSALPQDDLPASS
jgi:hypothetical protein